MTYAHALILGIIQGLTEFIPVSSSGHLVLAQQFFGLKENMLYFDIFVHAGTLPAVIIVFRKSIAKLITGCYMDIRSLSKGNSSIKNVFKNSHDIRLLIALTVGTLPAVIAGLTMKDAIEALFQSTYAVFAALSGTGLILSATFFVKKGKKHISPVTGFLVGAVQALAIIPGISRSGSTISTALFCGIKREDAGEFSFLLSIPVIAGTALFAIKDNAGAGFSSIALGPCLVGAFAAFLTGWGALVVLMRIVKRGKIGYFGLYCFVVVLAGVLIHV
ncbi:undecaprenyl-diphosphate phosphatase [Candidatus Latescibacterota bacterium]